MTLLAVPSGQDEKVAMPTNETKHLPSSDPITGEPTADESPPITRHFTLQSEKEVTIRQVAPLVMVLTGATFLNTISAQSVVIILPLISRDLNIPESRQQWVVSAYALTTGSFLLLFGKLGDVYGKRVLFIIGAFWFGATCLGSAFSPVEICIYTMRALQGVVSTNLHCQ